MDVNGIPQLMPHEAQAQVAAGALMVDVREQYEWDAGHVPDSMFVPLSQFGERFAELPKQPLVIICASGGRSQQAAQFLATQGYEAANVMHGIKGWARMGLPVE